MQSPLSYGAATPAPGAAAWEVVPSLCMSERYDSNVYFVPSTPGLTRNDFVTNVSPTLRINHNGDYAAGFLNIGGYGETYINNPNLNYIGTNGTLNLNLDNSIKRLLPNASLRIDDAFRYAPTPPGFVNPAAGTSPSNPVNIQNAFGQGLMVQRTNNWMNNGTVLASYATTASTSLNASYSSAILRFGSSPISSTSQPTLFNTTVQTGTVGGQARLSGLDILSVNYSYAQSEFTPQSTSGPSKFFTVYSTTMKWSRTLTPYLMAEVGGGGIVINPGFTTYAANASVVMNLLNQTATISYAHTAFPSFANAGQPLIGNVVSLSAIQKIDRQWQIAETASYSNSTGSGSTTVTYDSYFVSADLYYWVTSVWSTALSFDYMKYNSDFGTSSTSWNREVITFSVRATWD